MKQTSDFLAKAQVCIEKVLRDYKPKIEKAFGEIQHELKDDDTPVTELDTELEALLRQALQKLDPGIGLQGEEHPSEGNPDTFWLIDPIDGTEYFIRGIPFFRNMITLVDNHEPVFAMVYKPIPDQLYVAAKGQGSTCNGQPLQISNRPLKRAGIELASIIKSLQDPGATALLAALAPHINGYRNIGDFTVVLEGQMDGHLAYKSGGGPWDFAPRALLISEAGGRSANVGSDKYDYRDISLLATNPVIFDDLQVLINKALT